MKWFGCILVSLLLGAGELQTIRVLFSSDNPINQVYDTSLHTWVFERVYPSAGMYGWIVHPLLDLGVPDSAPYDVGTIWRQDYGDYAALWFPGWGTDSVEYDPSDLDEMWLLEYAGWGEPVTHFVFQRGEGIVIKKSVPVGQTYDINGDGKVDAVDVVWLVNCVYRNLGCEEH